MSDINARLERMESKIDDIKEDVSTVRERTAKLEVKAGLWGAVTGLVASIAAHFWKGAP